MSLTIWSAQRSGGRPLGRRHDGGGLEARMSMAWVPGCIINCFNFLINDTIISESLSVLCCIYSGKSFIYPKKELVPEQCPGGLMM